MLGFLLSAALLFSGVCDASLNIETILKGLSNIDSISEATAVSAKANGIIDAYESNDTAPMKFLCSEFGHQYNLGDISLDDCEKIAQNLESIVLHNVPVRGNSTQNSYAIGINQYTMLSYADFIELVLQSNNAINGLKVFGGATPNVSVRSGVGATSAYQNVDWRSKAPAVMDQGKCGSCWIYASYSLLQSMVHIALEGPSPSVKSPHRKKYKLAINQMSECVASSRGVIRDACSGGNPSNVLAYSQRSFLVSKSDYATIVKKQGKKSCSSTALAQGTFKSSVKTGGLLSHIPAFSKTAILSAL